MSESFRLKKNHDLSELSRFVFRRHQYSSVALDESLLAAIQGSYSQLQAALKENPSIYGVTTGFGDSCDQKISAESASELQENLISYLLCGTGPKLSLYASRAALLFRWSSLSRGLSGVSREMLDRMQLLLERDWIPVIPRDGSLGASGDLIPLASIAQVMRGEGEVFCQGKIIATQTLFQEHQIKAYSFKPKEALAVVNGTSAMAGLSLENIRLSGFLAELQTLMTAWVCLGLQGAISPFSPLVNQQARQSTGQAHFAERVLKILKDEDYLRESHQDARIQDPYSLRCSPQVMGPILETIEMAERWLKIEFSSVADNPLISSEGEIRSGGNFYGGYMAFGMDFLKIAMGHIADLIDRQVMSLMDPRVSRGLSRNLTLIKGEEAGLHHGVKALHQSASAITSEIMARSNPSSIYSRSSESHNQDKVSLGMTAANQCSDLLRQFFDLQSLCLLVAAQAIEVREIKFQGALSKKLFAEVRNVSAKVTKDRPLEKDVAALSTRLQELAITEGKEFFYAGS